MIFGMTDEERRIRAAAEALLTRSLQSQRSSFTQHSINRASDIVLSEDLIAGARHQGRMSNVRRFFCLFITFDVLFTSLMWLICTMLSGGDVESAFINQVVHYNIKSSLFDIVMAAVCRFTVLLLFYALLYINHWIIIALSTAATCAFLIAKVFMFDWPHSVQPVFEVLLILSSFVLSWSEAWFFDFRVIPQETQARDWIIGSSGSERAPLLSHFLSGPLSHHTESVGNFYSPMESPEHSDNEGDDRELGVSVGTIQSTDQLVIPILPRLSPEKLLPTVVLTTYSMKFLKDFFFGNQNHRVLELHDHKREKYKENDEVDHESHETAEDYKAIGVATLNRAWEIVSSPNWAIEYETAHGDTISSMHLPKPDGKIMKITGVIDLSARDLLHELFNNIEGAANWNRHLAESKRIQVVDDQTDIVYQATNSHGGGIVGARDFVILRHHGEQNASLISAGVSVPFPHIPPRKNFTRGENGVSCWAMEPLEGGEGCRFTWLLNTNLKGWLPKRVINASLSNVLIEFMEYLRNRVREIKD